MRFDDKVAVVTGAASGFGLEIARRLASEGARLVTADVNAEGGERAAAELRAAGGEARFVATDVSRSEDMAALFAAAERAFDGVDVIVNNAGIAHRTMPLVELPEADFDRVFAVNAKSVYLAAVHGVPALRRRGGGAIVNIASIGSVRPRPNLTAYNATKGAVATLTRGLAAELGPEGIRVNAVNPLAAETGFLQAALGVEKFPPAVREALEAEVPLRRLATPADVASAVAYLASADAAFLTGVCLDVDGGRSI